MKTLLTNQELSERAVELRRKNPANHPSLHGGRRDLPKEDKVARLIRKHGDASYTDFCRRMNQLFPRHKQMAARLFDGKGS